MMGTKRVYPLNLVYVCVSYFRRIVIVCKRKYFTNFTVIPIIIWFIKALIKIFFLSLSSNKSKRIKIQNQDFGISAE